MIAVLAALALAAALESPWRIVTLPRVKPAHVEVEADGGGEVVHVRAVAAAGSAVRAFEPARSAEATVSWQWKVDRVVQAADMDRRDGDDYAARFYVTFDVPLDELPFVTRTRIRIARALFGAEMPVAALCYVWDNRHPVGTARWNAYSDQVRMVVLRSGAAQAGEWVAERRDVAADFRAAFGERHPGALPAVTGIAVSADTDQTGESVSAWFRDIRWEAR